MGEIKLMFSQLEESEKPDRKILKFRFYDVFI